MISNDDTALILFHTTLIIIVTFFYRGVFVPEERIISWAIGLLHTGPLIAFFYLITED